MATIQDLFKKQKTELYGKSEPEKHEGQMRLNYIMGTIETKNLNYN